MMDSSGQTRPINVDLILSVGLNEFLIAQGISIAVSTYQSGNLFLIGPDPDGSVRVKMVPLDRPMGLCVHGDSLYAGTQSQVHRFNNVLPPGTIYEGSDRLYVPHVSWTTGAVDCHDVAVESSGRVVFVNTLYSCLAAVSNESSFAPVWRPPAVSDLAPEDRCHLNGVALRDGVIRYATSFSSTNTASGWRENKNETGVVWDTISNEAVVEGLTMPHSPRWYRERLWLLDSGSGTLGVVEPAARAFRKLVGLPGYLRGLTFHESYALVGSSIPREKSRIEDAPVLHSLAEKHEEAYCGLFFANLQSGRVEHFIRMKGDVQEIFDVAVLPGVRAPDAVGLRDDRIKFVLKIQS